MIDKAKRLQDTSNAWVRDLTRHREKLQEDLGNLEIELSSDRDKHYATIGESYHKIEELEERLHEAEMHRDQRQKLQENLGNLEIELSSDRDKHYAMIGERDYKIGELEEWLRHAETHRDRLQQALDDLNVQRNSDRAQHDSAMTAKDDEVKGLLMLLEDAQREWDTLNGQVQSLTRQPSRSRDGSVASDQGHGQMESVYAQDTLEDIDTSSTRQQSPVEPSASVEHRKPRMNTAAHRTERTTTKPPSVYMVTLRDAEALKVMSDVLPGDILEKLRGRFKEWTSRTGFKWSTSATRSQTCIETRLAHRKSEWVDGAGYVCAGCEKKGNLCVVVDEDEDMLLLLPRKAAEHNGHQPTDSRHWAR